MKRSTSTSASATYASITSSRIHLARGRRILCASPDYLRGRREPESIADLARHSCLLIRERNETFGAMVANRALMGTRNVRVSAALASNHGDVIKRWALEGHGIMLRSYWDVAKSLRRGELVHLLRKFWQPADVWAVTKIRSDNSAKTRLCIRQSAHPGYAPDRSPSPPPGAD